MKRQTVELLRSPVTGSRLEAESFTIVGDEIVDGRLVEVDTGAWYRIEDGIADLAPPAYRTSERHRAFCIRHGIAADSLPVAEAGPDANAVKQIAFFTNFDRYEAEVVQSPFYDVLDHLTIDRWLQRNLRKGASVVEVGCGSGRQTLQIARRGGRVVAVDLSEDMLRKAKQRLSDEHYADQADFVVGTAEELPVANDLFDAAVVFGSLHHFSDPRIAILRLAHALKPQGQFYLLEPHDSPVRFLFDWTMRRWKLWHEEANDDPLFRKSQLSQWLHAGGLNCAIYYSTFLPPHLWYFLSRRAGDLLLSTTDRIFGAIPGVRKLAGVIIAEAVKES